MKFKGLKFSEVALSSDELSLVKGGATVSKVSPDLFDLDEDRKKGKSKGKKAPAPQKPMPRDKGGMGEDWGENY